MGEVGHPFFTLIIFIVLSCEYEYALTMVASGVHGVRPADEKGDLCERETYISTG